MFGINDLLKAMQNLMEEALPPPDFTDYSSLLPLDADVAMYCQHLDDGGNRCANAARGIYHHFGDPEMGGGWYCVYVCCKHLAEVMHVNVVTVCSGLVQFNQRFLRASS